jgi:hypothetical protein
MSQIIASPARDSKIDIVKGLLVVGMIWGHVAGYTGTRENPYVDGYWNVLAPVTFSGFIFCMGYVMQKTYFNKESPPRSKMVRSSYRTLIGYYIATLAFFLIYKDTFDLGLLKSVLMLQQSGSISEFLLTFALIPLITIPLTPLIKKYVLSSDRAFFIAFFLLLMTTFIPFGQVKYPNLAILVGSTKGIYYPVLQYYPLFLLGAYYALRKIEINSGQLLLGCFCLLVYISSMVEGNMFSRFPPSFSWLLSCGCFLPWLWLGEKLSSWKDATSLLGMIGANSLFFLVVSDILIFGVTKPFLNQVSVLGSTILSVVIMAAVYYLMVFVRPAKS